MKNQKKKVKIEKGKVKLKIIKKIEKISKLKIKENNK